MTNGLLGQKLGMTQVFLEGGKTVPVTVIEAGPCRVSQVKTKERDGYTAVQLAFRELPDRKVSKPVKGHFAKANLPAYRHAREFRATGAWDGSSHEKEVLLRPHVDDLERLGGHPHAPHVPWQPLVLPDPRGIRTAPDRAWRAVEH